MCICVCANIWTYCFCCAFDECALAVVCAYSFQAGHSTEQPKGDLSRDFSQQPWLPVDVCLGVGPWEIPPLTLTYQLQHCSCSHFRRGCLRDSYSLSSPPLQCSWTVVCTIGCRSCGIHISAAADPWSLHCVQLCFAVMSPFAVKRGFCEEGIQMRFRISKELN